MIRRPPRSTQSRSSAASDVYKRQVEVDGELFKEYYGSASDFNKGEYRHVEGKRILEPVSYTHLRAHETVLDLVCRLLLEKKKIREKT